MRLKEAGRGDGVWAIEEGAVCGNVHDPAYGGYEGEDNEYDDEDGPPGGPVVVVVVVSHQLSERLIELLSKGGCRTCALLQLRVVEMVQSSRSQGEDCMDCNVWRE